MVLNILLDVLFIIAAGAFVFLGVKRGFIQSVIRSAKLILAFVLAYFLGGPVAGLLNSTFIGGWVNGFVYDKVNGLYQGAANMGAEEIASNFPSFLMTEEVKESIANASQGEVGEALVQSVSDSISRPIASLISNVLGYILVFLLSFLLLVVVAKLLTSVIDKIALLGTLNRVLGGIWGALTGMLVLFVAASVIKLFLGGTDIYQATVVVKFFGDSALLETVKILNVGSAWFSRA